ncbi:hypothetical protein R6Z07M_019717 [Ovis aries]
MLVLTRSSSQNPAAGVTATTITTCTVMAAAGAATSTMGSPVKRLRPLLPKETALAKQQVMWNPSSVQQKEITQNPSTSTITLVTSTYSSPLVTSSVSMSILASSVSTPITTASADVAADTAKYTSNVNEDTPLSTELQNLQWLYQQFSDMKYNLVVGKVPPSTATGSQTPPKVLVLNLSSSQTPMAGVMATTSSTCMVMAKLPLPPAPWETQ